MNELSLNILDLIQNAVAAKAGLICVEVEETQEFLCIQIADDGCGMPPERVETATDPFTTTRNTRRVGLGLALVRQLCEMTGGSFLLESKPQKGTRVRACFGRHHLDRPPLGDIAATMHGAILSNAPVDFVFTYRAGGGEFVLDTRQVRQVLGDMPLSDPLVSAWLRRTLCEGVHGSHQ